MKYSSEEHIYCFARPSVFSHIVLNADVNSFFINRSIKRLLCAVVVALSCLLSFDKNSGTLNDLDMILWMRLLLTQVMH